MGIEMQSSLTPTVWVTLSLHVAAGHYCKKHMLHPFLPSEFARHFWSVDLSRVVVDVWAASGCGRP